MSLYEDVLKIAETYMGVAAEEFIARRYKAVVGPGDPRNLKEEDIKLLAEATGITAAAYMSDSKAAAFKDEILGLLKK